MSEQTGTVAACSPLPSRVAVVHDWLVTYGGAERTLKAILERLPTADLFTLVDRLPEKDRSFLLGRKIRTSPLQRLPGIDHGYRAFLPVMPVLVEQFDLSGYDLIVSSSHAVAKGVITGPDQLHVSYIYSPMRYAWDLQHQYLAQINNGPRRWLMQYFLHRIRHWDIRSAHGVDHFLAISNYIARRVEKVYRRSSDVIYPPVDTQYFIPAMPARDREGFYLTASRLVPYKRIDLLISAFRRCPHRTLEIIGDGPEMKRFRRMATPNVRFLGHVSSVLLRDRLQRARAFVFAAEEDFGIAPLEAQACGTPVIAFGRGGALETVVTEGEGATGILFHEQTEDALLAALDLFEARHIQAAVCRDNALRFSEARFKHELDNYLRHRWTQFQERSLASFPRKRESSHEPDSPDSHPPSRE